MCHYKKRKLNIKEDSEGENKEQKSYKIYRKQRAK